MEFLGALLMPGMLGAFVLVVSTFAGCIHVKSFHVMGERHIRLYELPSLRDAFILVLVGSRCMREALTDPCRNIVRDQFHKCVGRSARQGFVRFGNCGLNGPCGFQAAEGRAFAGPMDLDKFREELQVRGFGMLAFGSKRLVEGGFDRMLILWLYPFEDGSNILAFDGLPGILNYWAINGVAMGRGKLRNCQGKGDNGRDP